MGQLNERKLQSSATLYIMQANSARLSAALNECLNSTLRLTWRGGC
jgi:hypothetical protein